jgi:uncharacterized lipoprotein YajG
MSKMLITLALIALLSGCAAKAERQENCTPQWPPGPCADPPRSR